MVRKITSVSCCVLLLICMAAATAHAETVYDGNLSSSVTAYVKDLNIPPTADYVYFRSGKNEYSVLVGEEIVYSEPENSFTLSGSGILVIITTSQYDANYTSLVSSFVDSYVVYNPHNVLIYTNLGNYPMLNDYSDIMPYTIIFIIAVCSLCAVLRSLFSFVLRTRYSVTTD